MAAEPSGYDLLDRPLCLVRMCDGGIDELSLLDTFRRSRQVAGLVGEVPTQVFALTRLLLAILHRAVDGPRDLDHWEQLWSAPDLPVEQIEDYLDRYRSRFDLLHPETPFLQVAGLHTTKGEMSGLARLIADVPNGHPFFTTRLAADAPISFAEAGRWLVHCHAFDPSGIKSGAVGDSRVKAGKGYPIGVGWSGLLGGVLPEGATLRDTLLLNLMADDFIGLERPADLPSWERDSVGPGEELEGGRPPTGPLDLYTWQSRRLRLQHDGERVTGVLICNGERITPQNKHTIEPHTAWRRSQAQEKKLRKPLVYMPKEHDPQRLIWRGLSSLLAAAPAGAQAHEAAATLTPRALQWLALVSDEVIGDDLPVHIRTIGVTYGSNNSVIDEIVDDALELRSVLLRQSAGELVGAVTACVTAAENAARALGGLAANLAEAAGDSEIDGPRSRATEVAYAELDTAFRAWLRDVRAGDGLTAVQTDWHLRARDTVRALAQDLLREAAPGAWVGRAVRGRLVTSTHAQAWFHRALRKAVPYAYADTNEPDTTSAEVPA